MPLEPLELLVSMVHEEPLAGLAGLEEMELLVMHCFLIFVSHIYTFPGTF